MQGLQRRHAVDTSLMIHFFGKDGKNELKYEDFTRFMENLQHEILELEFHEFSKGHDTISELDFAKILLRYTQLDTDEYVFFLRIPCVYKIYYLIIIKIIKTFNYLTPHTYNVRFLTRNGEEK